MQSGFVTTTLGGILQRKRRLEFQKNWVFVNSTCLSKFKGISQYLCMLMSLFTKNNWPSCECCKAYFVYAFLRSLYRNFLSAKHSYNYEKHSFKREKRTHKRMDNIMRSCKYQSHSQIVCLSAALQSLFTAAVKSQKTVAGSRCTN